MSVNDITGDPIRTDVPSDKFKSGWDNIWGKPKEPEEAPYKELTEAELELWSQMMGFYDARESDED